MAKVICAGDFEFRQTLHVGKNFFECDCPALGVVLIPASYINRVVSGVTAGKSLRGEIENLRVLGVKIITRP